MLVPLYKWATRRDVRGLSGTETCFKLYCSFGQITMNTYVIIVTCAFCVCHRAIHAIDVKGFDDTVLFKINWPGRNGNDLLDVPGAEPLIVTTQHNEQFKCLLPHFQEKEKDSIETYDGPNPLELLSSVFSLSFPCSYRLESYWTYELCHGRHVRQYHEEREGKKVKQQEYYLGKWDKAVYQKLYEELEKRSQDSRLHDNVPTKKIDGLNMPYLQVNMSDGTLCDLSPKPRFTKVLYICYAHGKHEISTIKETSTCEYEVVVLSPLLCKHPRYKPQESGENVINCRPLEGSPKKPRELLSIEAESLKLKQQKISDEKLQQVYAVFSIDRTGDGQDEEPKLRVEIHPVTVDEVETEPSSMAAPNSPMSDTSPVNSFLSGKHCLIGGTGWWRYEFCNGISVDQFHMEKDGTRTVVHLGRFDKAKHLEWLEKNPHKRPKPSAIRKQISHLYSGGSLCDKTGRPRQTEVKLKCQENSQSPGSVALFMYEPKTCEYVLGVESVLICDILPRADENGLVDLGDDLADLGDEVTVSSEEEDDDGFQDSNGGNELDSTIANGDE